MRNLLGLYELTAFHLKSKRKYQVFLTENVGIQPSPQFWNIVGRQFYI